MGEAASLLLKTHGRATAPVWCSLAGLCHLTRANENKGPQSQSRCRSPWVGGLVGGLSPCLGSDSRLRPLVLPFQPLQAECPSSPDPQPEYSRTLLPPSWALVQGREHEAPHRGTSLTPPKGEPCPGWSSTVAPGMQAPAARPSTLPMSLRPLTAGIVLFWIPGARSPAAGPTADSISAVMAGPLLLCRLTTADSERIPFLSALLQGSGGQALVLN